MKFFAIDLLLAFLSLILISALSVISTIFFSTLFSVPIEFSGIVKVALFIILLFIWTGFALKLVRVIRPLKEGIFPIDKGSDGIFWKLQGFLYIFNIGFFMNTYLVPINLRGLIYSFLGAKIGKSVMIGGKILEPPLVQIGDYTQLGEDTLITAHAVEKGMVTLGRVKVGRSITIGVKAVIFPGVEIGDNSIIAAGSVVTKNTKIPANETWGGIPAKKIDKR